MNKMIIAKTPLRITFFGGGTDYYNYFSKYGGKTLGSSVKFYSYIVVKKLSVIDRFKFRITHSKKELVRSYDKISHPVFKAALKYTNLTNEPLEILYFSDLPSLSGMGSSSSFVISLLNALYNYKGISLTKNEIAKRAIHLERKILKEDGGYQDQLTCAHGGICIFKYTKKKIQKIQIKNEIKIENFINSNFLLLYSNIIRDGTKLAKKQKKIDKHKLFYNFPLLVDKSIQLMKQNKIYHLGNLLDKSWKDKKKLAFTSNHKLDKIYDKAIRNGALGGKLLGVGGGGFFLFLVPRKSQKFFKKKMSDFYISDLEVDNFGSTVKRLKI